MSELVADLKGAPKELVQKPLKFVIGGLLFLVLVLMLEAWKPGIITGPIKRLLGMVGIGSGS